MDSEAGRVELLGCPFCGAEAIAHKQFPGFATPWLIDVDHAGTCPLLNHDVTCHKTRVAAVTAWNTRTPTPDNGLREALEGIRNSISGAIKRDDGPDVLIWEGHRIEGPAADAVFALTEAIVEVCDSALQHNNGERNDG